MDSDLLIPIFWTLVFGALIILGARRLTKKLPQEKKWVRPEKKTTDDDE